jgi:hypothetical protein
VQGRAALVKIVDRFPYEDHQWTVPTHYGEELILHYQIMVWIRLALKNSAPPATPIPAILDPGLNHVLAINESHLDWLKLHVSQLPFLKDTWTLGKLVPQRAADVYLQLNVRGTTVVSGKEPFKLDAPNGIVVFPRGTYPRLPILGLQGLTRSKLRTVIDGRRLRVSIDSGRCFERLSE